jgi:hypothetical protein
MGRHLKIIDPEMKHSPPARSSNSSARTRPDREIATDMIHALRSAKVREGGNTQSHRTGY